MNPHGHRDWFGITVAAVTTIVAATAGITAGWAILKPAEDKAEAVIIPVMLTVTELPPPEPIIEPVRIPEPIVEPSAPAELAAPSPIEIAPPEPEPALKTPPTPIVPKSTAAQKPPAPPVKIRKSTPPAPKRRPSVTKRPPAPPKRNLSRGASVLQQSAPSYPSSARRAGISGTTYLRASVSASGRVTSARIESSSGNRSLDKEALRAVRRWKFTPARSSSGKTIATEVRVPIRFQLK